MALRVLDSLPHTDRGNEGRFRPLPVLSEERPQRPSQTPLVLVRAVILALIMGGIVSVCPKEGRAQDSVRVMAEGRVLHKSSKRLYYFRIQADSTIHISHASGDAAVIIPATTLSLIFERVEDNLLSPNQTLERVTFEYEDQSLMLQFTQRFNLYVLIALIAVTVVGGSLLLWLWWRLSRERRRREALAQSRRYLAEGREKERERLAQEIHDGPVQDLHGLHMQLKALSGSADGRFETMGDELMRVTRELRAMSADLHPPALQRFGLAAALRSHADRLRDRHPDLQIELDLAEGNALGVPQDEYALSVFRIAQEAMNNAVQHGQARCIQVSLQCADNTLELDIRDDGDGFTPPDDWHALAEQDHYGLLGMRERAGAIGATLDIDSAPGEGTRVRLRSALPPAHPAEEHAAPPASVSA